MSEWSDRQRDWWVYDSMGNRVQFGNEVWDPERRRLATFYGIAQEPTSGSEGIVQLTPAEYGGGFVDRTELHPSTYCLRIVPAEA